MTRSTPARGLFQRGCWLQAIFILVLLGFATVSAEASPIRQYRVTAQGARDLRAWSNYLAKGVEVWARFRAPHISGAVKRAMVQALQSADPRSTPWVQYLLWRRGLNPRRFDFYHPRLGPILPQLPPAKPPVTPPVNPPAPEVVEPPPTNCPTCPEPSSIIMAATMLAAGWGWRYMKGRPRVLAVA